LALGDADAHDPAANPLERTVGIAGQSTCDGNDEGADARSTQERVPHNARPKCNICAEVIGTSRLDLRGPNSPALPRGSQPVSLYDGWVGQTVGGCRQVKSMGDRVMIESALYLVACS